MLRGLFTLVLMGVLSASLAACGGGGGDDVPRGDMMSVSVSFPPPNANLGGVSESTLAGAISGADGEANFDEVNYIDVNGVLAQQDQDDANRWRVNNVPVQAGANTLSVTLEAANGETDEVSLTVDNRTPIGFPAGMTLDAANDRILMVDSDTAALIAVDLYSAQRTVISDDSTGAGPSFAHPRGIALDADNNRALVLDSAPAALVWVDLASGDRTILSDDSTGGPSLISPDDLVLEAADNRALLVDDRLGALVAVDLVSGERTIVSNDTTGIGPLFDTPRSIALDAANGRAVVGDYGLQALIAVDLVDGNRTILSDGEDTTNGGVAKGSGPGFGLPAHLSIPLMQTTAGC